MKNFLIIKMTRDEDLKIANTVTPKTFTEKSHTVVLRSKSLFCLLQIESTWIFACALTLSQGI